MPRTQPTAALRRFFRRHRKPIRLAGTVIIATCLVSLGAFAAWAAVVTVPSIDNFTSRKVAESTKIYDRTGNVLLYDVHGTMRRTEVPLEDISPYIRNATIAIEDATFYQHRGFRPSAFLRAVLVNLGLREGFRGQGGSTITQQVVKNTLLTQDKNIVRKAKEIVLALKLERVMSKDEILAAYLNEAPYGGPIYGAEEASLDLFGKHAKDVTLAEAAYLAALPQAPTRYRSHRDELDARQRLVLQRMEELGFITQEEREAARAEEVAFQSGAEIGIKAPHFVFFVREYLEDKYGADEVASGGLQVITTLDYDLQQKAEEIVATRGPEMHRDFNASNTGLVAVDPKTGQILTMVGSRDFLNEEIDGQVNVTTSHRQPGSSFKPFVYATAFAKGYTPETVVFDLKTQFSTACRPEDMSKEDPCFSPDNFDGKFQGPISLRNALAQSTNIPAVKTLYLAGISESIATAERMGITTLAGAARYGLTLVLGGGEVTLLEITGAYGVFANDGERNPTTPILEVRDARGKTLEKFEPRPTRALEAEIARKINDILSDNVARTPEFGANSPLYFPGKAVAAKTGTTNDYHDVWIVGYTPGIAAGAWAGNNNNDPLEKRIAAFIIAPLWHDFLEYAMEKYPAGDFVPSSPDPDFESLPAPLRGEWNANLAGGVHEILHWVDKDNPRGSAPANPASDPQYRYWEYPLQVWSGLQTNASTTAGIQNAIESGFSISHPRMGSSVRINTPVPVSPSYPPTLQVTRVTYYLNGALAGEARVPPFGMTIIPRVLGLNTLRAVAETPEGVLESFVAFTAQ